jgi:hypothetical protein
VAYSLLVAAMSHSVSQGAYSSLVAAMSHSVSQGASQWPTVYWWHKNCVETGCSVRHAKSPGRPCVSDATVEQLRESLVRSPRKSMRRVSRETGILYDTVWRVLQKCLHLKTCKLSIVQHLTSWQSLRRQAAVARSV